MPEADLTKIVSLNGPVLCFDTCTALDLMRDPTRDSVRAHERRAALDLLTAIETSKRLTLLMAEQVQREYADNVCGVENEARSALSRLKLQLRRLDEVASVYGAVGAANVDHLCDHVVRARNIADRWIGGAALVRPGTDIHAKAFRRMSEARTPATKAKDSMKDCVVIETYLNFVTQLRAAGLNTPIVFSSSNVKDYAEATGAKLRSDLGGEFTTLSLEFAPNLAAAKHSLGL